MAQHDRPQPTSPRLTPNPADTRPEQPKQWNSWADQRINHAQRPATDQQRMILRIKITPAADPRIQAKARFVVEVQAKLHALLETISESEAPEPGSMP
jgi:hypothetical protein